MCRMQLYRLTERLAEASASVGVDDIERRQHAQQLTQQLLSGCRQASQPFSWIRAAGLRSIGAALAAGLEDGQALTAVLEATYSQVLEVLLSTLDRDLIPHNRASAQLAADMQQQPASSEGAAAAAAAAAAPEELLPAVGRYPAGFAPAAAVSEELQEAFSVLQALCLLHTKARALLAKPQYLQLVTARACEAPACLPAALNTLLALLQGNEEAQAMFVTGGVQDMLLTRTLQHAHAAAPHPDAAAPAAGGQHRASRATDSSSSSCDGGCDLITDGCGLTRRELLLQLLIFLQLLVHLVFGAAVEAGAHPSTQQASLALMTRHLGAQALSTLTQDLGGADSDELLRQRAEAAAVLLLQT